MTDTEILYELEDIHSTLGSINTRVGTLWPGTQPVSHVGTFPVSGDLTFSGTIQSHVVSGSLDVRHIGTFPVSGAFYPVIQEISGTIQSRILSGSVTVKNFPSNQLVSGTVAVKEVGTFVVRRSGSFWPTIQEISGTVQAHVLSGSINSRVIGSVNVYGDFSLGTQDVNIVGSIQVYRKGSFWPTIQEISGTVQSHVLSGSLDVHGIGTFRSHVGTVPVTGAFYPSVQQISGTVQSHILSGSISGNIRVTSGSINVKEIGTFVIRAESLPLPTGASAEATLAKLTAQGTFYHGRKSSIGTTAVQIGTNSVVLKFGVLVKAALSNYKKIYSGNSGVDADAADATSGFELSAGESIVIKTNKVNKVYVISTGTALKAFWEAV